MVDKDYTVQNDGTIDVKDDKDVAIDVKDILKAQQNAYMAAAQPGKKGDDEDDDAKKGDGKEGDDDAKKGDGKEGADQGGDDNGDGSDEGDDKGDGGSDGSDGASDQSGDGSDDDSARSDQGSDDDGGSGDDDDDSGDSDGGQFSLDKLTPDQRIEVVKELTNGEVDSLEKLQDVLKNSETPPTPFLSEDEQAIVAMSRKAKELNMSVNQAIELTNYVNNISNDASQADLVYSSMVIDDIQSGREVTPREEFNNWYSQEVETAKEDFMKKRGLQSQASNAAKQIQDFKSQFKDLKLEMPDNTAANPQEAKLKAQQVREQFLGMTKEYFAKNPDAGKLTFPFSKDEQFTINVDNLSELKSKVDVAQDVITSRWSGEDKKVKVDQIAKDLFVLENLPSIISAARDKAIVKEREALDAKRKKVDKPDPNANKGGQRKDPNAPPKNWEESASQMVVQKVRI